MSSSPDSTDLVVAKPSTEGRPLLFAIANYFHESRFKSFIFLFILFIFVTSDVFSSVILKKINGTIENGREVTPYGVMIQGVILVLSYIAINFLVEHDTI
jgi:hypothetical protein